MDDISHDLIGVKIALRRQPEIPFFPHLEVGVRKKQTAMEGFAQRKFLSKNRAVSFSEKIEIETADIWPLDNSNCGGG